MSERLQFVAFSMSLLHCDGRFLLIRRSQRKQFAPGKWTGVGGRIDPHELDDITASALREIREETGVDSTSLRHFVARRILLQRRPGHPLTMLVYFTGYLADRIAFTSPEGALHWLNEAEIENVEAIDNTAIVLPLLIDDLRHDPAGMLAPILGTASYSPDGELRNIAWAT